MSGRRGSKFEFETPISKTVEGSNSTPLKVLYDFIAREPGKHFEYSFNLPGGNSNPLARVHR